MGVWEKTRYWAQQLAEELAADGWVMECRRSVVKKAGKTKRQADGRQRMRRTFRHYTWAKIYREEDQGRQIFFTVGVDGLKQELVLKLDCMRTGSKGLDERLVARFDNYLQCETAAAHWQRLSMPELTKWNWKHLLSASKKFIEQHRTHYEAAQQFTWQGADPVRNRLARICWNTLGWQRPSGAEGKSTAVGSHESSSFAGFGAEEWLFNFERLLQGYHYGFLQPLNTGKERSTYEGQTFDIRLFTRNESTGTYFYAGRIRNAIVLTAQERQEAELAYKRKKWYTTMEDDLVAVGASGKIDMGEFAPGPFNLRFKPEDVERPDTDDGLLLIDNIEDWSRSQRYVLFHDFAPLTPGDLSPVGIRHVALKPAVGSPIQQRTRQTQARLIELEGLHDQVQEKLIKQLKKEFPGDLIAREACIMPDKKRLDVVRERANGQQVFYEVKVLPTLRACIREALGQMLEYAHWGNNDLSEELVIVSYHAPTTIAKEYLQKLVDKYGLPISYQQIPLSS
ncbi:hypothetical protein H9L05_19615 [Hymenobacter qilianensis]|uniref:Uncharacterized protein n=1 Tax=Hymenobacter qilianensis TaxID=1385715 RepID=A0A7H0GUV6_9BACT|nr:hypothetical protein [Hymenobacter qilianensis]QNP52072.1 hypothetical protein H9L05_19615 [Hymenobacter qilianensis]